VIRRGRASAAAPIAFLPLDLNFELKWRAGEDMPWLELGGRKGVKAFLAAEIGGGT
jgi:hypothetical protein